ncbi:MAG: RsmD family RNA methyltransferase [Thermoanaerobaculaceae bacterium]|nr:RsmD family RNA methyltransferase [Thermoanaerobaculaceae bacterium]
MSFSETLRALAANRGVALPPASDPEPLAALDYGIERALKDEALARFWREQGLPGSPEPVVPAPSPRGYRTTSKRRAALGPKGLALSFPGTPPIRRGVAPSALDLPEHAAVYALLVERLSRPAARALAAALNWAIVRGPAGGLAVILNVRVFDAKVVRAGKQLALHLQEAGLGVRAGFLYLDPSGSEFYLEARRPVGTLSFKRLFGPEWLQVEADGVRLRFPPTVFSQVNGAMLGTMTAAARALLAPLGGCALLDLYCGYGLFTLTAGREAAEAVGVDLDGPAVAAARANALHLRSADRVRFLAGRVDAAFLAGRLRPTRAPEVVFLDPPRQGTQPGVAAALAARRPLRVVHVCCGSDEIPREVAAWARAGYALRKAVPLDLFAGTANLETLLLLDPGAAPVPGFPS